jgi:hypothetical protein
MAHACCLTSNSRLPTRSLEREVLLHLSREKTLVLRERIFAKNAKDGAPYAMLMPRGRVGHPPSVKAALELLADEGKVRLEKSGGHLDVLDSTRIYPL